MKDIYELGCEAGLLNYIDHETPRVYFIHSRADLEDFEAFCKALTKERDDEIERLREALHTIVCNTEPDAIKHQDYDHLAKNLYDCARAALGEKE